MLSNPDSINLIQLYKPSSRYDTLFLLTKYLVMKYYEIHINLMFYIGVIMLFEVAEELFTVNVERDLLNETVSKMWRARPPQEVILFYVMCEK